MSAKTVLGGFIAIGIFTAASPAAILVDFGKDQGNNRTPWAYDGTNTYNRFVSAGGTSIGVPTAHTSPLALVDTANKATDVSLFVPNYNGFQHESNGNGVAFTYDGVTFHASAMNSYLAENAGAGRDAVSTFRFTSDKQYSYTFKIASSYHGANVDGATPSVSITDGEHLVSFNVGGTYSLATRSFTGGTTKTVDAAGGAADRAGATLTGQSVYNATLQKYVMEVHMGYAKTGLNTGNVAAINAMHIEYAQVPEPAVAGLLAIPGTLLLRRRR